MLKIFISDIDDTLTSGIKTLVGGKMEKQFNNADIQALRLLQKKGIYVILLTSIKGGINDKRGMELIKAGIINQLIHSGEKEKDVQQIANQNLLKIPWSVAFVGDHMNDYKAMRLISKNKGLIACPSNAINAVKELPGIYQTKQKGGYGAVSEFITYLASRGLI